MLNKFQLDILDYLEITADDFISSISSDDKVIALDDLVPKLIDYLGKMIKRDLDLHTAQTDGYNTLEDMLIEIHLIPDKEFKAALLRVALFPLRQDV